MNLYKRMAPLVAALLAAALLIASTSALGQAPPTNAEPVRLASLEWEPYIGTQLPDQGYVAALIRAAFADQGVAVQIEFYPWARALHLARTGEVDGLAPEYFDPTRESEFEYSAEFPGGPLVLYKRRDDPMAFSADPLMHQDQALRALQSRRFGVVRGYINTPVFDAADYLTKHESNDDAANLRKLVYGRIDLAVIDRRVAQHLIRTQHPEYASEIEPMAPALAEIPLFIAFSRKAPRMREALVAFNRGVAALRANGKLAELYQHHILHGVAD